MSEKTNNRPNKKPNYALRRGVAAALAGTIAAGSYAALKYQGGPAPEFVQGKEYTVKPGDTAWSVLEKAYPNSDPREGIYNIDRSLPHDAQHQGGLLQPGDKIVMLGKPKVAGVRVGISHSLEGQLPAVIPVFHGKLEPKDYGTISEARFGGNTSVVPNAPPPSPEG